MKRFNLFLMSMFMTTVGLFLVTSAANATSNYSVLITEADSTAIIAFESHVDTSWVDIHYKVNNGVQLNYSMSPEGSDSFKSTVPNVHKGDNVRYSFTYNNGFFAYETEWNEYTVGSGGSDDDPDNDDPNNDNPNNDDPNNGDPNYSENITEVNSSAIITFTSNVNTSWVDIHYKVSNGNQLNYRMNYNGPKSFKHTIPALTIGDSISYSFTYNNGTITHDTTWNDYTFGNNDPDNDDPDNDDPDNDDPDNDDPDNDDPDNDDPNDDDPDNDDPDNGDPNYSENITEVNSSAIITFTSNVDTSWVDIHYKVSNGNQLNYRMNHNGSKSFKHTIPALAIGDSISYSFTYNNGTITHDTTWNDYTFGNDDPDDDDPDNDDPDDDPNDDPDDDPNDDDIPNLINLNSNHEMTIQFKNSTSGAYPDNQIYACIIARNQASNFCYITPDGTMVPITEDETSDAWFYKLSDINGFQIPKWAESGRLYISMEQPVIMRGVLETDTGMVGVIQPDLNNPDDPNQGLYFEWMEFTVQPGAFWGNTTQVDQYSFSYTMELFEDSGSSYKSFKKVGITKKREQIFNAYENSMDEKFTSLVQRPYRIVAPCKGDFRTGKKYGTYMQSYIDEVWNYYRTNTETVNHPLGNFSLRSLADDRLEFTDTSNGNKYYIQSKPDNNGLFEGSGPLAEGNSVEKALQAQMCAALNRHVATNPSLWAQPSAYYQSAPANFYAKFWHEHSLHGLAYGFCYDDVAEQSPLIENHAPRGIILDLVW